MKIGFFAVALSLLMISQAEAAFEISPISAQIIVTKGDNKPATRSFYVHNLGKQPVALEFGITKRILKPDGKFESVKVDNVDDILTVYPKQFVVKDGEKRTVRVTYKGPKDFSDEIDYRFTLSNVSVRVNNDGKHHVRTEMKIDIGYEGSIYVTPSTSAENLQLKSFEYVKKDKMLRFQINNAGNRHHILRLYTLEVTYINDKGETKTEKLKIEGIPEKEQKDFVKATGGINAFQTRWYSRPFTNSDVKEVKEVKFKLND